MGERLLIQNGTVVTLGEHNRVLPGASVLCEGGRIRRILEQGRTFDGGAGGGATVLDARGMLVLPGFINAHMHFYSTFARGLGKAEPAADFQEVLRHLWWRLDRKLLPEDCYWSALVPLADAVRHGTTTLIDHHASPCAVEGSLDRIADAVRRVGLRAALCYEVSDRDGEETALAGIEENLRFLRRCRDERDHGAAARIRGMFGLHAAFTLGDATLERAAAAGAELGAGFHVHVAEARCDQLLSRKRYDMPVVERLHRFGILGAKSIAAHCVHVDEREMEILRATGTAVVHNPQSNMNNAVGTANLVEMRRRGLLVGLGTDAMTADMREELRGAVWAQRLARGDPGAGFAEAVWALTAGNPAIARRQFPLPLGTLEEGAAADIILVDYRPPTPLDGDTFPGHLVFGLALAPVDTTIVAGKILMQDRRLAIDLDEAEIAARARERAAALWRRF